LKAITFLGTGDYKETHYTWNGDVVATDLFPHAVWELFHPNELLVFVTDAAREKLWKRLLEALGGRCQPMAVRIPEGRGEQELWTIFDAVVGAVEEGDTVLFDITHAFRSIPLIVLLAIAYLKAARGVTLQRLVYGAYEARDKESNLSPIFDLTPMASLLDWLAALHLFQETGRGGELAGLLEAIQDRANKTQAPEPPRKLKNVAASLGGLSDALRLIRPLDAMQQAQRLHSQLDERWSKESETWARPFALIAPALKAEAGQLAGEADALNLTGQAALLTWYQSHGQPVQALTLAREMVVTWMALGLGENDLRAASVRKPAEAVLNWWGCRCARKRFDGDPPARELTALGWSEKHGNHLGGLWNALTEARNDVNHAGMRPDTAGAGSLESGTRKLVAKVRLLVVPSPSGPGLSKEEIDRYIEAERASWGDP
jgi:CRISPR-associated DxTHG motif protein